MNKSTPITQPPLLSLLDKYEINPEQRRIIADASTKPPEYQAWFVDQFTRNRCELRPNQETWLTASTSALAAGLLDDIYTLS